MKIGPALLCRSRPGRLLVWKQFGLAKVYCGAWSSQRLGKESRDSAGDAVDCCRYYNTILLELSEVRVLVCERNVCRAAALDVSSFPYSKMVDDIRSSPSPLPRTARLTCSYASCYSCCTVVCQVEQSRARN